jgi:hypothetical protein
MSDIEKCAGIITELERKRVACVKRGVELADERAAVALGALTGDAKAAKRLAEIHTALATQTSELASFDAALKAAGERLRTAQATEEREADKVAAHKLREVAGKIGDRLKRADKYFAAAVEELNAADAELDQIHASGSDFPTRMQFKVNAELALITAVMRLPEHWWRGWGRFLAPNERRSFSGFWAKMQGPIEARIKQRLCEGEQTDSEAA